LPPATLPAQDPTTLIRRASSIYRGLSSLQADFVFRGVTAKGNGIRDLADTLASHPDFPYAWAHKLCYYANSAPCVEGAELDRVVTD
jgi:hypothetical protein